MSKTSDYRGRTEAQTLRIILEQMMPSVEAIEELIQDNKDLFEAEIHQASGLKIEAARLFLEDVIKSVREA